MDNAENKKLTPQQEAAITHKGSSLLVSSAAGSGKTMVLVERLMGYIDEKHSIDEFLIITYTRAAALELRQRIYDRLQQRLAKTPGNLHLRRQSMLCRGAYIDTIHTFCSAVLRENAHLAGLSPDFRVADENECSFIKRDVLEDVFEQTYENISSKKGMSLLLEILVDGRDDRKLEELVAEMHNKLRSTPDPDGWVRDYISKQVCYENISDISHTQYGVFLLENIRGRLMHCRIKMLEIKMKIDSDEIIKEKYAPSVNESISSLDTLIKAIEKGWDEAVKHANIPFPAPKPISGYDELKAARLWCKKEIEKITKNIKTKSSDHISDMKTISPAIEALLNLVLNFDKAYTEEKRKRAVVDFSDLEHITLSLLYDKQTGTTTPIASAVSKRFKEILIDEYQDVNEVQEKIFTALSQDGHNIFMVGDVKQSIYRFRLADPSIFLSKYRQYSVYPAAKPQHPVKIHLTMNFRSRPAILETVNHVFRKIMSVQFGEMDYTETEELIPGRKTDKGIQGIQGKQGMLPPVELDILTTKTLQDDEEESPTAIEIEAKHVAGRIKELIDLPYMIEDSDGSRRKLRYGDIAILSRSIKGITWRYANALTEFGIPADVSDSDSFFGQTEVKAIISLLTVIDNPMQDIPLAALLSGPVYAFTSDELAEIRTLNKGIAYYDVLKQSNEHNMMSHSTACKCKRVLEQINELRLLSKKLPSDKFIWNVYNMTGILKKVTAMKNGEKRRNNLLALAEFARAYENSGYKGLFGFLNYIDSLRDTDTDITDGFGAISVSAGDSNKVKILSIHKSKGLEFPVVFLVNLSKKHNMTDLYKPFIFDKTLGVGGMLTDLNKRIRYTTLARVAVSEKQKEEMMSEELRVLYVAMTRAKEKLIMCASFNDGDKSVKAVRMLADTNGRYSPQALMSMNSIGQWIIAGLLGVDNANAAINMVKTPAQTALPETSQEIAGAAAEPKLKDSSGSIVKSIHPPVQFSFIYPHEAAVNMPSKLTITALKSITDPEAENATWTRSYDNLKTLKIRKPAFISGKTGMTAAQRGTVVHEVMRYIDYDKCSNENIIRKQLQSLVKRGFFNEDEISGIDNEIHKITKLFKSGLGKRLMNAYTSKSLIREFKFSLLTPAEEYFKDGGEDGILLQGIIDCYFEENGCLVVVDFKTDNITAADLADRVKKYTPQLEGYSKALMKITGKEVKESVVYFFGTGDAIPLVR